MYAIIGWIAVQIALGHSGHQAPVGAVARWLLVAGSPGRPWTVAAGDGRARAGNVRRLFDRGSAPALIVAGPILSVPSWPLQEKNESAGGVE